MKKKLSLLLLLFLVCILSISAISATENTANNDVMGIDNNKENNLETNIYSDVSTGNENCKLSLEQNNDDKLKDTGELNFNDLNRIINGNSNSTINLSNNYKYDEEFDQDFVNGIIIDRDLTIYGNGITLNGDKMARIFNVIDSNLNVSFYDIHFKNGHSSNNGGAIRGGNAYNCSFTNNTADYGGAIYLGNATDCTFANNAAKKDGGAICQGNANNCTFTKNTAEDDGGAIFGGGAINCTFIGNKADYHGGAIHHGDGKFTAVNCTFTGNSADGGGATYGVDAVNCIFTNNTSTCDGGAVYYGDAKNCTFIGNIAERDGGAIYRGNAYNCTFIGNSAQHHGGAMYEGTTCLCIFNGDSTKDTKIIHPVINVLNYTSTYNSGEKLKFNLTANDMVFDGFKTTIAIYKNTSLVKTDYALTGEGWIVDLGPGEYTAVLSLTDYSGEGSSNATISVSKGNTFIDISPIINAKVGQELTINFTTNSNGTVTVKVNGQKISGAKFTPTKEGSYNVTVEVAENDYYTEASNETTFTVEKTVAVVEISPIANVVVGQEVTIKYDTNSNGTVTVKVNGQKISGAKFTPTKEGSYNVTVEVAENDYYTEASNETTFTVTKVPTEIKVTNTTLNLEVNDEIPAGATLYPTGAGNLTYTLSNDGIVEIEDGEIIALKEGNVTITVSFKGNNKYLAAENKTINVTVTLKNTRVSVNNNTLDLFVDNTFTIVANTTPKGLKVTYKPDNSDIISVDENGVVTALKEGNTTIIVSVGDNKVYAENTTTVTVTVSKIPTEILIANETLDLKVSDEVDSGAGLNPSEAGNLTYTISETSIIKLLDNQIIALSEGSATISYSFAGNDRYAAAQNKTITVKVSLNDARVTVDNDTLDLKVDERYAINATKYPDTLYITYTSSDSSVATVDEKGIVTAISEGTAIITLEVGDGEIYAKNSTNVTVTVSKIHTEINIEKSNVTLNIDDEVSTGAALNPEETGNLTYMSSDESVAVVKDGKIIALKEGNAIITVSFKGNYKYAEAENKTIEVTVKKLNPGMDITAEDITEGENATINVELPIDATGNVTTTVNGKTYSSPVDNGKSIITIPGLEYGNYTLPVTYSGDDKYNSLTKDVNLTVNEDEIVVSAPDLIKYYSGSEKFVVNVSYANGRAIAGKEVKITINGVTYKRTTDENGSASLSINLNSATYDTIVEVDNISVDSLVMILPTIEAENIESKSKNLTFKAVFLDGEGNYLKNGTNVSFNINGVIYDSYVNDDKGSVSLNLTLDRGRYIITSYNPVSGESVSNNIAVDLKDADMILSGDEITAGENATVGVTLPGDATGNVTTSLNGKNYTSQVNNGKADIIIPDLASGNYTIPVTYSGDNNYNPAVGEVNIIVNENATVTINAENLTKYYKDSERFTVKITDAKGQPAANKTVEITINGVTYKRTTNENGTASLSINLNSGVYPVRVVVDGVEANFTVTVQSTIDSSDIVKIFRNGTQYNAIFTDSNGKPLANIKVSFNIHGVIYNRTTDRNGASKLNINLDAGDYIITAFNLATDEIKSNNIKVISLIESGDLTKYYRNASQFVVRIHSADGGYVGAGEEVSFNINGVIYTRLTNATGHAKLNINLRQGNYIITTYYKDCGSGNNIKVLPILTAEDLSMKYMDGSQFKAKLVDGKGNPYPNKSVTFNINGVFYNRLTDSDGVAKLNIRLMAGQYIITSSYNGCNIANKITIWG